MENVIVELLDHVKSPVKMGNAYNAEVRMIVLQGNNAHQLICVWIVSVMIIVALHYQNVI